MSWTSMIYIRFRYLAVCLLPLALIAPVGAATVQLQIEFDPAAQTWDALAEITDDTLENYRGYTDPGDEILGLASFNVDLIGSDGIEVATSTQVAPKGVSPAVGFTFTLPGQVADGTIQDGNAIDISGTQPFDPSLVIEDVALRPGDAGNGVVWDHPVLLATGTYTGTVGSLTLQERLSSDPPTGDRQLDSGVNLLYGDPAVGWDNLSKIEAAAVVLPHTVWVPEPAATTLILSALSLLGMVRLARSGRMRRWLSRR